MVSACPAMQESARAQSRRRGAAGCSKRSPGCAPADAAAEVLDHRQLCARRSKPSAGLMGGYVPQCLSNVELYVVAYPRAKRGPETLAEEALHHDIVNFRLIMQRSGQRPRPSGTPCCHWQYAVFVLSQESMALQRGLAGSMQVLCLIRGHGLKPACTTWGTSIGVPVRVKACEGYDSRGVHLDSTCWLHRSRRSDAFC